MTTLSDNELLLEVARMKFPGARIEARAVRAVVIHTDDDLIHWYPEANTIHPLWAEYGMDYVRHLKDTCLSADEPIGIAKASAFHASLSLRGMLEAVWTVLKEGK